MPLIRVAAVFALGFIMTACTTPEEIAKAHHEACLSYGIKPNTELYSTCRMNLMQAEMEWRRNAAMSVLMKRTTTNCTTFGNQINCQSY